MSTIPVRSKLLIPFIAAFVLLSQTVAWAAAGHCLGCQMAPATIVAPRNHVPARSLLLWSSGELKPPAAPQPVHGVPAPVYRAPTLLPAPHPVVSTGLVQHCTASTYGYDYRGVAFSAASKEIPHGHHASVTAPNGNTVTVLINDSGPYIAGRCIDLSMTAMHALGYPEGLIDNVTVRDLG